MITIFKARKILTMNPSNPVADYVAVKDGKILGAGKLEELTGWGDYEINDQFAEKNPHARFCRRTRPLDGRDTLAPRLLRIF